MIMTHGWSACGRPALTDTGWHGPRAAAGLTATARYATKYNLVSGADQAGVMGVHGKFDELGRFADPSLLILTSLADGPKHGYAIMTDIAGFSGVQMEPGTLYRALSWLERRGWVRPLETEERRRPYEITAAGQVVLAEQVATMQEIVRVVRLRTGMAWGS